MIEINEKDIKFNQKTNREDSSILYKRARAKYFSFGLMFRMIDIDSPLHKGYWNTYHCASTLVQEGDKISSRYCKNRWCLVCNRIRTAICIKKYYDEIKSWGDDKYFITLTLPNVSSEMLSITIDDMLKNFDKIRRLIKYRKYEFMGVRKLEATYNPIENNYHPHFHFVIKGKEVSELLVEEWLVRNPGAERFCQDVRKADDDSVLEIFKYFTKIVTSKHSKNFVDVTLEYKRNIYILALDNIFRAFRDRRTFQHFGFKSKNVDEIKEETVEVSELCDTIQYYDWEVELSDWVNVNTGHLLTGYKPSDGLKQLIDGIVTEPLYTFDSPEKVLL